MLKAYKNVSFFFYKSVLSIFLWIGSCFVFKCFGSLVAHFPLASFKRKPIPKVLSIYVILPKLNFLIN